ncbi:hypothetical protein DPMN_050558 [Dreissena polymorpha]|uniref:Uncharacterized protein n=1 Tax=Dreissena polymorpha TaxID=45954 RepID=A0A9D4HMF1_DREPO|nr:hypothetical protein DPMN_050558 [Dreissena polymorpha]
MQKFPGLVIYPYIVSYIHLLGGTIYTVEPIVYILVRKTNRKRLMELFVEQAHAKTFQNKN